MRVTFDLGSESEYQRQRWDTGNEDQTLQRAHHQLWADHEQTCQERVIPCHRQDENARRSYCRICRLIPHSL